MVDGSQRAKKYATYTERLAQLIRDVCKELKALELSVVFGELSALKRGYHYLGSARRFTHHLIANGLRQKPAVVPFILLVVQM